MFCIRKEGSAVAEIRLKSEQSAQAVAILSDALKTEELRLVHALGIGTRRLTVFEEKYGISSETFIKEWTAEDLRGGDVEYAEWAGEIKLADRLKERLAILKGIEYVA
jgi:hypothetical protein